MFTIPIFKIYNNININDFEWETYINNYIDLKKAGINNKDKALQHWINYGKNEGRTDKNIIEM